MRIIAGKWRSRKLNTLEGLKTRPTLDQTKEAIFSSMGNYLNDCVTLDVFGGSGALSLESLSRGAKKAYIIDNNPDAIKIINSNKEALHADDLVVYQSDYMNILNKFANKEKFDVIFLDPPFKLKVIDELISFVTLNNMVNSGGFIMAEYPMEDVVCKSYPGYKVRLCRRYSSSEVLILEKED